MNMRAAPARPTGLAGRFGMNSSKSWRAIAAALLLAAVAAPAAAQMFDGEYQRCNQGSTVSTVECVNQHARAWDKRLNTGYKALLARSDPGQREPLKQAQRAWIQYRDANCRFYASGEGTLRAVEAAECVRVMTRQRSCELEVADRPEGGGDTKGCP